MVPRASPSPCPISGQACWSGGHVIGSAGRSKTGSNATSVPRAERTSRWRRSRCKLFPRRQLMTSLPILSERPPGVHQASLHSPHGAASASPRGGDRRARGGGSPHRNGIVTIGGAGRSVWRRRPDSSQSHEGHGRLHQRARKVGQSAEDTGRNSKTKPTPLHLKPKLPKVFSRLECSRERTLAGDRGRKGVSRV